MNSRWHYFATSLISHIHKKNFPFYSEFPIKDFRKEKMSNRLYNGAEKKIKNYHLYLSTTILWN